MKKILGIVLILAVAVSATGCAAFDAWGEGVSRSLQGVNATLSTYDANGNVVDEVKGRSFRVERDTEFDTSDDEGGSNADSSVLKISLGDNIIRHVGSTLVIAENGIISVDRPARLLGENNESGRPWLNSLRESFNNKWKGKGKTLLIRSQDSLPIAIYAGDNVEVYATDVPKSTAFRIDGRYLFVYRADYTVYDNDLLD